jgi:hypothetical protein
MLLKLAKMDQKWNFLKFRIFFNEIVLKLFFYVLHDLKNVKIVEKV